MSTLFLNIVDGVAGSVPTTKGKASVLGFCQYIPAILDLSKSVHSGKIISHLFLKEFICNHFLRLSYYNLFEMSVIGQFSAVNFTEVRSCARGHYRIRHNLLLQAESPCCLNKLSET